MSRHVELLGRASDRGSPRGIDRVVADARHRLRRRRQGLAVVAGIAVLGTGFAAVGLSDDGASTSVASSETGDFVAVVPDPDRFELVSGGEPESNDRPATRDGTITIYQRLNEDGTIAAAVAVGVVEPSKQQSTLLDVQPLADGTAQGENGTYALGHNDEVTNGLVIVERTSSRHIIRVAGRHLDVPATVGILESVDVTDAGEVARIELPDGMPQEPVYSGPDVSHFGTVPDLSTSGRYRDLDSGQEFTVLTSRGRSALPAEALAWRFDGTVLSANPGPVMVGGHHDTFVAYWRLDVDRASSVTVYSDDPLTPDALRRIQADSQPVDAAEWSELLDGRLARTDVTTTTPVEQREGGLVGRWTALAYSAVVVPPQGVYVQFDEDGRLEGDDGCNEFTAQWDVDADRLVVENFESDGEACEVDVRLREVLLAEPRVGAVLEGSEEILEVRAGDDFIRFGRDS